jgi:archaellum component FlaC
MRGVAADHVLGDKRHATDHPAGARAQQDRPESRVLALMAADDGERQLGILIGKVDGITGQLAEIGKRLDRSDESRRGLHGRMDGLAEQVQQVKSKVEQVETKLGTVANDVAEMKPEVALVKGIKGKVATAVVVLTGIGGFIVWMFGNFWEPIRAALARVFH